MNERDRPGEMRSGYTAYNTIAESQGTTCAEYSEEAREQQLAASQLLAGWPLAVLPEHVRGLPQVGQLRPSVHGLADDSENCL
jgi:hypothetical protein